MRAIRAASSSIRVVEFRQEARVRRAVLLTILFEDVLLLLLGVTRTSRAVLLSILFEDVLFLLLGESTAICDPGRSVGNVDVMRVHGAW